MSDPPNVFDDCPRIVSGPGAPDRPLARFALIGDVHAEDERLAAAIPPVSAVLQAHVSQAGDVAEVVHACLLASPGAASGECTPRDPEAESTVDEGVLRADVELPFPRGMLAPADLRHLGVALRASAFRVDALGALAPASTVTDLGGILSATLHWRGTDAVRPVGRFSLRDGLAKTWSWARALGPQETPVFGAIEIERGLPPSWTRRDAS